MKNYSNYETEDFVQDHYFRKWVQGKLAKDDSFWTTWLSAHPEQFETIEQARNMVVAFQPQERVNDPKEIRSAIDAILSEAKTSRFRSVFQTTTWKIAASVILIAGLGIWFLYSTQTTPADPLADAIEEVNDGTQPRTFQLSDSTSVTLSPKSRLTIDSDFGKSTREVSLIGEAVFHVKRNTEKPFFVYAGDVVTKVLGTSFRIKAFSTDASVSVAVHTGKVTVFKQKSQTAKQRVLSEEILLTPNQQAVYQKEGDRLIKTLVDNPLILSPDDEKHAFYFADTPIPQVFLKLEKTYGVRIIFDEELLRECNFTAKLGDEPLFEKLNLVCETIQAQYEILDGQVVIFARKCQSSDG
jgi:transmembrane sensor